MQKINLIFAADFVPRPAPPRAVRADGRPAFADAVREASKAKPRRGAGNPGPSARTDAPETEREEPRAPDAPEAAGTLAAATAAPIAAPAPGQPGSEAEAEQNDVSILGGQTTDWSLPGQTEKAEALPVEPRDTARMPENPATDTIPGTATRPEAPGETEPCPPENANVETARGGQPSAPARGQELRAQPLPEDAAPAPEDAQTEAAPDAPGLRIGETGATEKKQASGEGENAEPDGGSEGGASKEAPPLELAPERIASGYAGRAAQTEAPPDAPVSREELIPAMVERLEVMVSDGQKSMSLELKPEFLGRVTMTLVSGTGGVAVKILASDPDVRSAINGEIAGIIERMGERGIRISSVELADLGSGGAELSAYSSAGEAYSGGEGRAFGQSPPARAWTPARIAETRPADADAARPATYPARPAAEQARGAGYGGFDWYGGEDERVEYSA